MIGLETIKQLEMAGGHPDVIVGCAGGGSNYAGIAFPYIGQKLRGETALRIVAVEPAACSSLTKGKFAYDFGGTTHMTPLVKMHTHGSTFVPPGIHAGVLRYHGMAPATLQLDTFAAGSSWPKWKGSFRHRKPITLWRVPPVKTCVVRRKDGVKQFCSPMWTWLL